MHDRIGQLRQPIQTTQTIRPNSLPFILYSKIHPTIHSNIKLVLLDLLDSTSFLTDQVIFTIARVETDLMVDSRSHKVLECANVVETRALSPQGKLASKKA